MFWLALMFIRVIWWMFLLMMWLCWAMIALPVIGIATIAGNQRVARSWSRSLRWSRLHLF